MMAVSPRWVHEDYDIESFILKDMVINCKTLNEAKEFINAFFSYQRSKRHWTGLNEAVDPQWNMYKDRTCYYPNHATHGLMICGVGDSSLHGRRAVTIDDLRFCNEDINEAQSDLKELFGL